MKKSREEMVIQIATETREFVMKRCEQHNLNVPKDDSVGMAAVLSRAENDHTEAKRNYYNGERRKRR